MNLLESYMARLNCPFGQNCPIWFPQTWPSVASDWTFYFQFDLVPKIRPFQIFCPLNPERCPDSGPICPNKQIEHWNCLSDSYKYTSNPKYKI